MRNQDYMQLALAQAQQAAALGEVPVGAVLVDGSGQVITTAHNAMHHAKNPAAHAEMQVLQHAAQQRGEARLVDCDLYVTLEPCTMCAAAISLFRIRRLYFGAYDPKGGGVEHGARFYSQPTCHHTPDVYGGMLEAECQEVLQRFFQARR